MRELVVLLAFTLLVSCAKENSNDFSTPKKVIIAGKVENIDPNNLEVKFYVNRLGLGQSAIFTQADSLGNFQTSFETYTPTDVWVQYKTNILVLVEPGDSIHVAFDGQPNRRPQILETIKFSGDGTKANQDAAKFQFKYFSNPLYYDWDAKQKAKKIYDADEYLLYLDTLQRRINDLYHEFLAETAPDNDVKIWAKTYIDQDYYDALSMYPMEHLMTNNLKRGKWDVPDNFYDALLTRLPIEKNMLISGYALSSFINRFHFSYSAGKIWDEEQNKQYKTPEGYLVAPPETMDSLSIYGLIKYTPDTLLRQMVLTEFFAQSLDNSGIRLYEKYKNIADEYILEPYLREPLFELYSEVKNRIENPEIATNAYLKKLEKTTARQLFDSILTSNKGKVIYLDCWATWCGPCKAEMPHSKRLMEELKDNDIAFVFLCIDSEEDMWKANLAEFQIGGQHYFLTREQSSDLRKAFEVQGIPHYFLIDQSGVIVEKGSHLRPNNVKDKLLGFLGE